ncbi:membrane protease subunit HflC [Rhizobium sp. SG_E_25_P2]|jgi:modulator of FtsH protease HflC|uniref:protease modulator HflC n=1 Tax=Rhizobium sp. SG_E_25_P2 TaxID=2879942 RepID=UPI002475406E|nr:protease modulator HflC [Rhizobium sp. SG_E_25_P2]MDH6267851.1 membrane protease subunit HflC [Rhizobium sp. SG_E_25_P2]
MTNRLAVAAIGLFIIVVGLFSSFYIVNARQQAIVIRFGQITDVKTEPGIYFKMPFAFLDADRVQYVSNQELRLDLDNMRVQVSGGKFYEVDAFVVYKITNARLFREIAAGDVVQAESRLRTRLDSALRRVYGLRGFEAALSNERASMMKEVRNDITKDAESLGLTITDVRIRRTDLTKEVSQQTFDRMKAERLAEAEAIRARGNEGAQRRRAVADRGKVEIVAAASKDAQILRGQGEAERNRIFGEAFTNDPEFYAFYRSMQAYQNSLGSGDSTLVLSPESEFFQYFKSEVPKPAPSPAAAQ